MKLLIDTNVVLDILLKREPFCETAINVLNLLTIVSVAGVAEQEISNALGLEWNDFEDSVQYSVALLQEMDGIITRNPADYKESEIQVWLPEEALSVI